MIVENPTPFLRLFIALAVPPVIREALGRAQGQLQRLAPPGTVRWTRVEQFHVTLSFLGEVPQEQVDVLPPMLAAECAGFGEVNLAAYGIGLFPGKFKPRVIWAGAADPGGGLAGLQRLLEESLQSHGLVDARSGKFAGHITLGRFKPGPRAALTPLLKRAETFEGQSFGAWRASEVQLVRCVLTAQGARHTVLSRFPLAG